MTLFFERPDSGEIAVLVHVDFVDEAHREDPDEFLELVASAGVEAATFVRCRRSVCDKRYFIGSGKLTEILDAVQLHQADVVIFNHDLSPSQERNLERELQCRVLGRTGLILDIFAQRARSHEGKLQVELAQLQHMSTRLIRGWTHLERQKGGIGLRGPGETQLETDRRLLRARISTITSRLEKVERQRNQGRRSRTRADVPTVALVGYTNAGKSTLFNSLTDATVYAADQLFATLDPTLRRIELPHFGQVVLADTVGFIRHLPHKLVQAFRATLEEAAEADLLLHVVDAFDEDRELHYEQVMNVLAEINADHIPRLMVYNKVDMLARDAGVDRGDQGRPERVWLSARTGEGCDLLREVLAELLGDDIVDEQLTLAPKDGRVRARLHDMGAVLDEQFLESGDVQLRIRLPRKDYERVLREGGLYTPPPAPLW